MKTITLGEWIVFVLAVAGVVAYSQVATAPVEPYTKDQTLSYNQKPTGVQVDMATLFTRADSDGNLTFDVALCCFKDSTQIKFVSNGMLVDQVRVTITEAEINAVLATQGVKPNLGEAIAKAAAGKLPK